MIHICRTECETRKWELSLFIRIYYCQNWRHDVVAVVGDDSSMVEWVAYSPYGVPFGFPWADSDSNGKRNNTDVLIIQSWVNTSTYDVRGDTDLDGDVDNTDVSNAQGSTTTMGRGVLSDVDSIIGYAGYVFDTKVGNKWHVRYRVLDSDLGRWLTRDPIGYLGGENLYLYVLSAPVVLVDPQGLGGPQDWEHPGHPGIRHYPTDDDWWRRFEHEQRMREHHQRFLDWRYKMRGICAGRRYDPDQSCCEKGVVVPKESIWECDRPLDFSSLFWGTYWGAWGCLHNCWLPKGREIGHSYICCDGPNKNCYGLQSGCKKGQNVPKELLTIGTCKEKKVCPRAKGEKCNNAKCKRDYDLFGGYNCQDWAYN